MSIAKKIAVTTAGLLLASLAQAANFVYQTGSYDLTGTSSNEMAMNNAFGWGKWSKNKGFDISQFDGARFVYLDGSEYNAEELGNFLATNQAAVESFVSNGGRLFINAAPSFGDSFSMNFGVTLNFPAYSFDNITVTSSGIAAGLTEGGISTVYKGSAFAHAIVSGGGISDLVHSEYGTLFGGKFYGDGYVAFGSQTPDLFHTPTADAAALRVNELKFIAAVPEPETYAMLGAGLAVLAFVARRKRSVA